MKTYKEFHVFTEPLISDILSGILWELPITGINEEDNYIKVFADGNNVSVSDVISRLQKMKDENLIAGFRVEENILEYRNWNEEWEKKTNVIRVSDSIVIKPTFREYEPAGNETIITIDPKMSFGTGEHQTTKLSLILLNKYIAPGMKILDVGTGTGVLAIAALKFGADYALGIDIDEWTLPNFKENAKLNSVEDKSDVRLCELNEVGDKDFDLVAANIQKNVLIEICDGIYQHLNEGGKIVLSGLLLEDQEDIRQKYTGRGFRFIEVLPMDEWIGMVFTK